MAIRFKLQGQGGSPFTVSPLGQAFGNIVNAWMSGPNQYEIDRLNAAGDLDRLKGQEYSRRFSAQDKIADVFKPGPDGTLQFDPAKQAAIIAEAARGGFKPDEAGGYSRIFAVTGNAPQPVQDRSVYAVAPYSSTKGAFDESQATEIKKAGISAGATIQAANIAQAGAMDRTTVPVIGPDGKVRLVTAVVARSDGYTPVLDDGKMSVSPVEGQPGKFQYQPNQPGLPAPIPSSEKDRFVLSLNPNTGRNEYQPVTPGLAGPTTAGEAGGVRMQKISDAMKQFGLSQADATALVDGHKTIQTDPTGGRTYLIDKVGGTVQEVPIKPAPLGPRAAIPPAPATPGQVQPRLAETTGVLPSIAEAVSGTLGQIAPKTFGSPQVTSNRQDLGIINELAIETLLKNSRASVAEQNRIREILPSISVGTSAAQAATRLGELRDLTVRRIEADRDFLAAPMVSREARSQAEERMRKADMLLREIDRFMTGGQPQAPAPASAGSVTPQSTGPMQGGDAGSPPAGALKEGVDTTFANGQTWRLQGGRPVRVR